MWGQYCLMSYFSRVGLRVCNPYTHNNYHQKLFGSIQCLHVKLCDFHVKLCDFDHFGWMQSISLMFPYILNMPYYFSFIDFLQDSFYILGVLSSCLLKQGHYLGFYFFKNVSMSLQTLVFFPKWHLITK